jgi:hypothetical protein
MNRFKYAALGIIWILTFKINHGQTVVYIGAPHMAKADCEAFLANPYGQDFLKQYHYIAGRVISCTPIIEVDHK